MQNSNTNKTLLIAVIVLAALLVLILGVGLGMLMGKSDSKTAEVAEPGIEQLAATDLAATAATAAIAADAPAKEEKKEPEHYGFYPSFYVNRLYYTVSYQKGDHTLRYYTDGFCKVKDAWTDSRWLDEEDLDHGGYEFSVKENKNSGSRKGRIFLKDDQDRVITVYVTQTGCRAR